MLLLASFSETYSSECFHIKYIAHVIHLPICDVMTLINGKVEKMRNLLNSIRASVKICNIFDQVQVECNSQVL